MPADGASVLRAAGVPEEVDAGLRVRIRPTYEVLQRDGTIRTTNDPRRVPDLVPRPDLVVAPFTSARTLVGEPLPGDYYRRETLPPSAGGHARHDLPHAHDTHHDTHASTSHATATAGTTAGGTAVAGDSHGHGSGPDVGTKIFLAGAGILLIAIGLVYFVDAIRGAPSVRYAVQPTVQYTVPTPAPVPVPVRTQPNPGHAWQQAMCDEQAEKRRALGIDSRVIWDNPNTCRATGGFTEDGRL